MARLQDHHAIGQEKTIANHDVIEASGFVIDSLAGMGMSAISHVHTKNEHFGMSIPNG